MAPIPNNQSTQRHPKPPDPKNLNNPTSETSHLTSYAAAASATNPSSITYASLAASKVCVEPRFPDLVLPPRQYGSKDGIPTITFSTNEIQASNNHLRHTIVAKFQMGRPSLAAIRDFAKTNWKTKGRVTMSANWDDRHIVFIFDSEEDVTAALTCPYRKVNHTYFRLFRWTPDYNPKTEATLITKWVKLPDLPMPVYNRAMVKAILSSFCHFLDLDDKSKNMTSLSVCRACVEIDISKPIPSKVLVHIPGGSFYQDVIIEGSIDYCSHCRMHGHTLEKCFKITKMGQRKDKGLAPITDDKIQQGQAPITNTTEEIHQQANKLVPTENTTPTNQQTETDQTATVIKEQEVAQQNKGTNVWVKVHSKRKKTMKPVRSSFNDSLNINDRAPTDKADVLVTKQASNLEEGEIHDLHVLNKEVMPQPNGVIHTREPPDSLVASTSTTTRNMVALDPVMVVNSYQVNCIQSNTASATGDVSFPLISDV